MTRRLRVLSIASAFPYPPTGGTRILIYNQLTEMSRHHDVDLIATDAVQPAQCDVGGLPHCRSVTVVPLAESERSFSTREKVAITARRLYPFFLYQRYSPAAQQLVDDHLGHREYDVVIAEDGEAGLYVRAEHPALKVLTKHAI